MKPLVLACLIDPFVQILRNRKMGATAGNRRRRNLPQPLQFRGPPLIPLPVTSCLFSRRRRPLIPTTGNNPHVPDANYMPHRPRMLRNQCNYRLRRLRAFYAVLVVDSRDGSCGDGGLGVLHGAVRFRLKIPPGNPLYPCAHKNIDVPLTNLSCNLFTHLITSTLSNLNSTCILHSSPSTDLHQPHDAQPAPHTHSRPPLSNHHDPLRSPS